MDQFLSGAVMAAFLIAGLFFLRFWRKSSDRIFLFFAVAFFLLSAEKITMNVVKVYDDTRAWFYLFRLTAFLLLIVGIVDKNRHE